MRTFKARDDKNVTLVPQSRWIKIRRKYVTRKHSLAEYADFAGTEDDGRGLLNYFYFRGKAYAIGQFMSLSYPVFFEDENGNLSFLCGHDCTDYSQNCLMIEMDDCCEAVRLFIEKREEVA